MKARYSVDLTRQQAECSKNYLRLLKLLPDLDDQASWQIVTDSGQIQIELIERAPYTSTIVLCQQQSSLAQWAEPLALTVRLYHDAEMAEVVAWNRHRGIQPRYTYPNRDMYHEDEKSQMNHFLGDWLAHGLSFGRIAETVKIG